MVHARNSRIFQRTPVGELMRLQSWRIFLQQKPRISPKTVNFQLINIQYSLMRKIPYPSSSLIVLFSI